MLIALLSLRGYLCKPATISGTGIKYLVNVELMREDLNKTTLLLNHLKVFIFIDRARTYKFDPGIGCMTVFCDWFG